MGEYDKEFRGFIGKPLPLKILGYLSVEEMAENMTDVISMIRLSCGTIMLQAVPDENTLELANEIQNQRYRDEGINFGMTDMSKLKNNVEKIRRTPEYLKKIMRI